MEYFVLKTLAVASFGQFEDAGFLKEYAERLSYKTWSLQFNFLSQQFGNQEDRKIELCKRNL